MFENKAIMMIGGMDCMVSATPVIITSVIGTVVMGAGLYCLLKE